MSDGVAYRPMPMSATAREYEEARICRELGIPADRLEQLREHRDILVVVREREVYGTRLRIERRPTARAALRFVAECRRIGAKCSLPLLESEIATMVGLQ